MYEISPDDYKGREQTYFKHMFLQKYLPALAAKVLNSISNKFAYVDAFAGPWETRNKELSDTSFDQSIKNLNALVQFLEEKILKDKKRNNSVAFHFCEKKGSSFEKLSDHCKKKYPDSKIDLYRGRFEENSKAIASECTGFFTFTFIDPKGFKVNTEAIAQYLKMGNSEFLFNFMSDYINRFAEFKGVESCFGGLLNYNDWKEEYDKLPEKHSNEEKILILLKRQLKEMGAAKYLPDLAILHPKQQRIKMRLVLGTNHIEGLVLFRDIQKKLEEKQLELLNYRVNPLFAELNMGDKLGPINRVGSDSEICNAKENILCSLRAEQSTMMEKLLESVLENFAVRETELKDLLIKMKKEGLIEFDLKQRQRKPSRETIIRLPSSAG